MDRIIGVNDTSSSEIPISYEAPARYDDKEIVLISMFASTVITTSMLITNYIQERGSESTGVNEQFEYAYDELIAYQEYCGEDIFPRLGANPEAYCSWENWSLMNDRLSELAHIPPTTVASSDNKEIAEAMSITLALPLLVGMIVVGTRRLARKT